MKTLQVHVSVDIQATIAAVWNTLTRPELVKQYLFGTQMQADWKVGGKITYSGEWEGKPYEDHGTILALEPQKKLVCTYWSAAFGEDIPENYQTITYSVTPLQATNTPSSIPMTRLEITQDNVANEESREHSQNNWQYVADKLSEVAQTQGAL